MFSAVAMLSALLALAVALPRYTLPPTLDAYQDAAKCVEVNKTWYLTYTSARLPELPNHVTCIRFANVGPMKNDETLSKLQYNPNGTIYIRTKYYSGRGHAGKNILYPKHLPDGAVERFDVLYNECESCKVYGLTKKDGGMACVLYLSEKALRDKNVHCHFIFDLLCGPSKTYVRSDSSCLAARDV